MSKQNEWQEDETEEPLQSPSPPQKSQAEGSQPEGQIVVKEPHVKRVAVSEHGDTRSEKPGRPAADRGNESKNSPEKDQHAERDDNFFGSREAHKICRVQQCPVKQHIVPLADDVEAGCLALFDQLGQPRVVDMACKVASLDVPVPQAWHDYRDGDSEDRPFFCAYELPA